MNNWQEKSDEELAEALETTAEAIKSKCKRLKLKRQEKVIKNKKIYTFEEVKTLFENEDYTLIDTEYVNYTTKMEYICNKHKDAGIQKICCVTCFAIVGVRNAADKELLTLKNTTTNTT